MSRLTTPGLGADQLLGIFLNQHSSNNITTGVSILSLYVVHTQIMISYNVHVLQLPSYGVVDTTDQSCLSSSHTASYYKSYDYRFAPTI